MARKARVEFEGAVYHVLDRGDRREPIFKDDADRLRFLETLGEVCGRTGWRVHAYVLMSNHYHFLLETPQANLVAGMRYWFAPPASVSQSLGSDDVDDALQQAAPAQRAPFSRTLQGCSPIILPPLVPSASSVVVDSQESRYFAVLSDYIHLNPVRARMVGLDQRLFDFPWSSYPLYVAKKARPPWFEPRVVLEEAGSDDTAAGRRSYAQRMRQRAVEELSGSAQSPERDEVRRGWCMGGEGFRERMLRLLDSVGEKLARQRTSPMEASTQRDHGLAEARHLLEAGLRCVGLEAAELAGLQKGDARKAAIAAMIRANTAVPNAWIAKELQLGHVSRLSHCIRNAPADLLAMLEKSR